MRKLQIEFSRDVEKMREYLSKPAFVLWRIKSKIFMESLKNNMPFPKDVKISTATGFYVVGEGTAEEIQAQKLRLENFIFNEALENPELKAKLKAREFAKIITKVPHATPMQLLNSIGITISWKEQPEDFQQKNIAA